MKNQLWVYADFDWLKEPELMGKLTYENLRGNNVYGFCFDKQWLAKHSDVILSDDLNNYTGWQYKQDADIFGCFSDSLPDRWGRTLMLRKEQIMAEEEGRPIRNLNSYDYLINIDDFSRVGGFRFKMEEDGPYLNNDTFLQTPPITDLRTLLKASSEIELSEEKNELPEKKWIMQLNHPGTSLGGARPKANVLDEEQQIYVAKFPSRKDTHDVGLWEHISHQLAKNAGISSAETSVIPSGEKYHIFLSRRFDRNAERRRIHFASAMTVLGLTDGANYQSGNGYLDIVDFITRGCTDVEWNLQELYRRVAFNICIGNSDDHFRNHGFLLTPRGWTLSPAYDMNPTLSRHQSLLISPNSNEANLNELFIASEEYMLEKTQAKAIIQEVVEAVNGWQAVARRNQASKIEMDLFAERFRNKIVL